MINDSTAVAPPLTPQDQKVSRKVHLKTFCLNLTLSARPVAGGVLKRFRKSRLPLNFYLVSLY